MLEYILITILFIAVIVLFVDHYYLKTYISGTLTKISFTLNSLKTLIDEKEKKP